MLNIWIRRICQDLQTRARENLYRKVISWALHLCFGLFLHEDRSTAGFLNGSWLEKARPSFTHLCSHVGWLQCLPEKAHQFTSHCNRGDFEWLALIEISESFVTTFLGPLTNGYCWPTGAGRPTGDLAGKRKQFFEFLQAIFLLSPSSDFKRKRKANTGLNQRCGRLPE